MILNYKVEMFKSTPFVSGTFKSERVSNILYTIKLPMKFTHKYIISRSIKKVRSLLRIVIPTAPAYSRRTNLTNCSLFYRVFTESKDVELKATDNSRWESKIVKRERKDLFCKKQNGRKRYVSIVESL